MTVIAGLAHEGKVYMAADRGMSDKGFIGSIVNHKIARSGDLLIGYSASMGTGQLAHLAQYPTPRYDNLEAWLRIEFCDALQKVTDLFKIDINTAENGADLLVGVGGRVFEVSTEDWSVAEYDTIATGSGFAYALGSLHSTRDWEDPRKRVREAVRAAITYSPSCQGPVDLLVL